MEKIIELIKMYSESTVSTLIIGIVAGLFSSFILLRLKRRVPEAFNVGVLGFPKSGKTTLITSIFNELLFKKVFRFSTILRGSETIDKVASDIRKLKIGERLGSTTDQDLFAYKVDVLTRDGILPIKRTIKVQIGDYPGEDTKEFYENFGDTFHKTSYFKWVMEADAFLFIIDIAEYINSPKTYSAKMKSSIMSAWQHIIEYHVESKKSLTRKPVVLVFSKADLIWRLKNSGLKVNGDQYKKLALNFGSEESLDELTTRIKRSDYEPFEQEVINEFKDLIIYFEKTVRNFDMQFASHFVIDEETGYRFGINRIIKKIIPA